ncbi:MAG: glycosyltransferase family 2 protein [Verrucomicrobiota bacterium]
MQDSNHHFISIVTPCYNEEGNVEELYRQVKAVVEGIPGYDFELIYIDNASKDGTVAILRRLAAEDKRVKVILNNRNFGHIRSPYHALLQAKGEAMIGMVSDLQDPPELIVDFVRQWEAGFKIVLGQKIGSDENGVMFSLRRLYYRLVNRLSDVDLLENVTGTGLYDREVVEMLRSLDESYPYVRGLVAELGYPIARIPFNQPNRKSGITKNNWYTLYDMAMLGFTSHSKIPLRLAAMLGFAMSLLSFLAAIIYFIYKLLFWKSFPVGIAPAVIGLFLFSSVQLFFIGVIGEYIGAMHTKILSRPLVTEKERINF